MKSTTLPANFLIQQKKNEKKFEKSKWEVNFADEGQVTLVEFHIAYDDLAQLEATIQMGLKEGLTMATMEGLDELLASNIISFNNIFTIFFNLYVLRLCF